jgi:hypothetical protein
VRFASGAIIYCPCQRDLALRIVALSTSSSTPPRRPSRWPFAAALSWAAADGSNNRQIAAMLRIQPVTVGK